VLSSSASILQLINNQHINTTATDQNMGVLQLICPLLFLLHACVGVQDISDFDALENVDTWAAAVKNTEALNSALLAANSSTRDRIVWIPPNTVFYIKNLTSSGLYDVTIIVDGTLKLNNDLVRWEHETAGKKEEALYFVDCEGIHITGTGTIDGQGLAWWRLAYLGVDYRPHFIEFYHGKHTDFNLLCIHFLLLMNLLCSARHYY
jgi:hypothetical protein